MRILVDGDVVAYRAASAAARTHYVAVGKDGWPIREFPYKREFDAWVANEAEEDVVEERYEKVEPEAHALQNAKSLMFRIKGLCEEKFNHLDAIHVWLSSDSNFRKLICRFNFYKGQRTAKPVHLPAVREYLAENWGAMVEDHVEADDCMAADANLYGLHAVCMATNDKDLTQIPGWKCDFTKRTFHHVHADEATRFFWRQMLVGDPVDNISGVYGVGDKKANLYLGNLDAWDELQSVVLQVYHDTYGEEEGGERFLETYRLLRMLPDWAEVKRIQEEIEHGSTAA